MLNRYFPGRLTKLSVFPVPPLGAALWRSIRPLLDGSTAAKAPSFARPRFAPRQLPRSCAVNVAMLTRIWRRVQVELFPGSDRAGSAIPVEVLDLVSEEALARGVPKAASARA